MSRNLELKAPLADLQAARKIARRVATAELLAERQTDTYFHVPSGRLKLREIAAGQAALISYARPDRTGVRLSDYLLVPVPSPALLKAALTQTLGVRTVVTKSREIYLCEYVRIHLDRVEGLGTFLEFEAVLTPDIEEAEAQRFLDWLASEFRIAAADTIKGSYGELAMYTVFATES